MVSGFSLVTVGGANLGQVVHDLKREKGDRAENVIRLCQFEQIWTDLAPKKSCRTKLLKEN